MLLHAQNKGKSLYLRGLGKQHLSVWLGQSCLDGCITQFTVLLVNNRAGGLQEWPAQLANCGCVFVVYVLGLLDTQLPISVLIISWIYICLSVSLEESYPRQRWCGFKEFICLFICLFGKALDPLLKKNFRIIVTRSRQFRSQIQLTCQHTISK